MGIDYIYYVIKTREMKNKTAYDVYVEKAKKIADALPAPPNEISQAVLWLSPLRKAINSASLRSTSIC